MYKKRVTMGGMKSKLRDVINGQTESGLLKAEIQETPLYSLTALIPFLNSGLKPPPVMFDLISMSALNKCRSSNFRPSKIFPALFSPKKKSYFRLVSSRRVVSEHQLKAEKKCTLRNFFDLKCFIHENTAELK